MSIFKLLFVLLFIQVCVTEQVPAIQPAQAQHSPDKTTQLLSRGVKLANVELPTQAIPLWRTQKNQPTTLVLLSDDPFLMGIPDDLVPQVANLIQRGSPRDFEALGKRQIANPVLLPQQAVVAALQDNLFDQLVWVLPATGKTSELDLNGFREQVSPTGILSQEELAALTFENGVFRGTVRGTPFLAAQINHLPKIAGPVIVHFDLSYFAVQYRNEVSTPIYSLVRETLLALRATGWSSTMVTLSVSTEEGSVPLELRFLKDTIEAIFDKPARLDASLPETWRIRKEARYLEAFFQPEAILDQYLHLETLRPKDASVKFDIYRTLLTLSESDAALDYLDRATALDSGYGREHILQAQKDLAKQLPDQALVRLRKAEKIYPHNPFLTLSLIEALIKKGQRDEAARQLQTLQGTTWSTIYYPEIPETLEKIATEIAPAKGKPPLPAQP